jgi:hypothetical protein
MGMVAFQFTLLQSSPDLSVYVIVDILAGGYSYEPSNVALSKDYGNSFNATGMPSYYL